MILNCAIIDEDREGNLEGWTLVFLHTEEAVRPSA